MGRPVALVLAIAWRNLSRNPRRALIAGSGIALGVGMGIGSFGVMDGMGSDMIHSVIDVRLGHVQVHEPGYASRPKLELAFEHAARLTRVAEGLPGVTGASPRVLGWGLASSDTATAGLQLVGVDPERESRLTHLEQRLIGGKPLRPEATPWPDAHALTTEDRALDQRLTEQSAAAALAEIEALGGGSPTPEAEPERAVAKQTRALVERLAPRPERPPPLLLGDKLARKLHAAPGTLVSMSVQTLEGDPSSVDFQVVGVVHTGDTTLDSSRAVGHIADVQRLFGLGDRAHELAIRAAHAGDVAALVSAVSQAEAFHGLEVKSWQQLRPDVVAMLRTNDVLTALLVAIIVAAAAVGVADTILMAVFERRRELGMLKALGMRPRAIVAMVMTETVLLSLASSLAGVVLGLGLDFVLQRWGIPLTSLSSFSLAGATIPPMLHAELTLRGVLVPLACMLSMACVAAVFPAWVAARTEPMLAMRN